MVKLTSFLALSTLIIVPTFASELWDLETRDVTEPHLFGRELSEIETAVFARDAEILFARQQDFEHPRPFDLHGIKKALEAAQKIWCNMFGFGALHYTAQERLPHHPFSRHQLPDKDPHDGSDNEFSERDLDYELSIRDDELFERFYDDLD